MRNLLDFLARHNHWILFLFLEVVSFVLLFQYNSYQGSVWFSSANAVTGKVYAAKASVDQYFSLVEVNRQLTARNLYLEREVSKMAEAQATLAHDTTYLERLQRSMLARYKSIPARVVSNSLDKLDNFITIDNLESHTKENIFNFFTCLCQNVTVTKVYLTSWKSHIQAF